MQYSSRKLQIKLYVSFKLVLGWNVEMAGGAAAINTRKLGAQEATGWLQLQMLISGCVRLKVAYPKHPHGAALAAPARQTGPCMRPVMATAEHQPMFGPGYGFHLVSHTIQPQASRA